MPALVCLLWFGVLGKLVVFPAPAKQILWQSPACLVAFARGVQEGLV